MKLTAILLAVSDIERSVKFYGDVLGLRVVQDFGANKTLEGGIALQTITTWQQFLGDRAISLCGNDMELYFEVADFDDAVKTLETHGVEYVHREKCHSWGQRVVRFYDPDYHIIEIGEDMRAVVDRFRRTGMSLEEIAERMDVSVEYVLELWRL